ncbi:MAG: hypothetical protein R3E86_17360 [Pseudomonadales bacterium]
MTFMHDSLRFVAAAACAVGLLAGCGGGGDINISADNNSVVNDNSTSTGGGSNNPCANYTDPDTNTLRQGSFDGTNCTYGASFVSADNPLVVDLTIPFITGVHIFQNSLVVGENDDGTNPAFVPQTATLTIEAGSTLAWIDNTAYLMVNRGSQIIARGSQTAPITLTATRDAVNNLAQPNDVQLWGGVILNGRGITNKCDDAQRANDTCDQPSEGAPANYGGNDNADNSGVLEYVVVKHTGAETAPGDEINGITFNAIGSGTTVNNIEVYSTYDDGVEFFGGAVVVNNLVALYARDDSIDYSDGWVGGVNNALVVHWETDGNRCIEGDNQGTVFDALPQTNPTVRNMTCIISGWDGGTHGDSEGPLLRRGVASQLIDSIITDRYARLNGPSGSGNECLELNDDETYTNAASLSSIKSVLIACQEPTKGCRLFNPDETCADPNFANGDTVAEWVLDTGVGGYAQNTNNVIIAASDSGALQILDGIYTPTAFADDLGNPLTITPEGDHIGAVTRADDWTANWVFGLDTLWFPNP